MDTQPVGGFAAFAASTQTRTSQPAALGAAAPDKQMFLQLLVAQIKNQDPTNPMDGTQFVAQLAQFSQLQQLENMNTSFGRVLDSVQRNYASSLIGKEVSFKVTGEDGAVTIQKGKVDEVTISKDGSIQLQIGSQQVSLTDLTAIRD
jgi:flagellar basal-body rod modification protein FlgD